MHKPSPGDSPYSGTSRINSGAATPVGVALIALALLVGDIAIRCVFAQQNRESGAGIVTAREFRVVGQDGAIRATLGTQEDGAASLRLLDKAGKPRAVVSLSASNNASMIFYDADAMIHAQFVAIQNGGSGLTLHDRAGKPRLVMTLPPNGSPNLAMNDKDGKSRVRMSMLPDSSASLLIGDPDGKGALGIVSLPDGKAGLTVRNAAGETVFQAPP